jgi:hypothetical protein
VALFKHKGREDTLFKSKDAFLVESCSREHITSVPAPLQTVGSGRSLFRKQGDVQLIAHAQRSLCSSGSDVYIHVQVKNDSTCKVRRKFI